MIEEKHKRRFQSISEAIKDSKAQKQNRAKECMRVMDEIIRPAIQEAGNQIKVNGDLCLTFNHGDQSITAGLDGGSQLRFICRNGIIEARTKINGETPIIDHFDLDEVSTDLVVAKIANFFRLLYGIPSLALEENQSP